MSEDADRALADMIVGQGLAAREHVDECLALLQEHRSKGTEPMPSLADLLSEKGYISDRTLRLGAAEPSEASLEKDIGKYVLISMLGRGGMGEVWKAREKNLNRDVAIKFLRGSDALDARRFLREAQVVSNLNHPNIAQVYELGTSQGRLYLAMQFINGTTLDLSKLDFTAKLRAIRDIARALDFAHHQGIVHRDIKPTNIMVEGDRAYLMDFGIAREARIESAISQTGTVIGTPQFMSPEQARGQARLVDARSDVYSLGATLYALACKQPPFKTRADEDMVSLLQRIAEEEPIPPRMLNPGLSWEVETIILQATEKDRFRRYKGAAELADDLQRYLDGEPIHASRPTILYRMRKKFLKHWKLALAVGAAVLIGFAAAVYFLRTPEDREWVAQGAAAEASERWEEALQAYRKALAIQPRDPWLKAKVEEMARRAAEADREERARRAAEEEFRAMQERLQSADFKEAGEIVRRASAMKPESSLAWYVLAFGNARLGHRSGALDACDAALKRDPSHVESRFLKAKLLIERAFDRKFLSGRVGPLDEAAKLLAGLDDELAKAYRMLAEGRAVKDYCLDRLMAREGKPGWEEFYLIWGMGQPEKMSEASAQAVRANPKFVRALIEHGDYDAAIELCPSSAQAYARRGHARKAVADLDRALEFDPRYLEALLARAALRDPRGAVEDLTRAIELDPLCAPAYCRRAEARVKARDPVSPMDDFNRAIELDPRMADAYSGRALERQKRGHFGAAIRDFTAAIAIDPQSPDLYHQRALAHLAAREFDAAIGDHTHAIDLQPSRAQGYLLRGVTRQAGGDAPGALADYGRAIELNPKQFGGYLYRSLLREELARREPAKEREHIDGAVADLEQALKSEDVPPVLRDSLESSLTRLKQR